MFSHLLQNLNDFNDQNICVFYSTEIFIRISHFRPWIEDILGQKESDLQGRGKIILLQY